MAPTRTFFIALVFAAAGSLASAGGHDGNPAVKARKAHMQLYAHNLGILGGMARGNMEYDADAAQAAASNMAALSSLNQRSYWAPGTSNAELGDETKALPAIWEQGSTAGQIGGELAAASAALAEVAGNGLEALGPALGPVGATCGACHKAYRVAD
ncbi:MAG: cytochrome c [Boseongicola sp.]|nr:cytochrome c [Boseongicola sp.]MDD9978370.1 cytochrome c [Boseongicola sp.]